MLENLFSINPLCEIASVGEHPRLAHKEIGRSAAPVPAMMGFAVAEPVMGPIASIDVALATCMRLHNVTALA